MQIAGRWKTYAQHLVHNAMETPLRDGSPFRLINETGGIDYDFESSDAETMFNDNTFHTVDITV
jgi:hypothetical protein